MAYLSDKFLVEVRKKQEIAEEIFKKMFTKEEQESKQEILDELLEQIEVCEGFYRPITEKQMKDWLTCANVEQILRKARMHKAS